jgi:Na+-transporting NADH:ubiquinone oxidoreductase subunit F
VYKIIINGTRAIAAEAGRTLLAALAEHGIFLPSVCGGRAICGLCRVKVLRGAGPANSREASRLGQVRPEGMRLACQVRITGDIEIELPPELLGIRDFRARCAQVSDIACDIRQLRLELVEPPSIDYVPGQYVQVRVPRGTGESETVRAYSIASDPREKGMIELIVRRAPGGISTTWIFERLREADEVRFSGPYGDFRLTRNDVPAIFVAGASGMAPIRCMLYQMKNEAIRRPARFYFGTNRICEMFHLDQMRQFEKELPDFRFVPVVARPEAAEHWNGKTGLVTEALQSDLADVSGMEAYLCGSPGMIEAAVKVLRDKGMKDANIFYDKFA